MRKKTVNLITSFLVLIPSSVIISDYKVTDLTSYFVSGSGGIIISLIICLIVFGINKLRVKNFNFITTLYSTNFIISIVILIIFSFKYI